MALSIEDVLAAKGVTTSPEHLEKLEAKWDYIIERRGDLADISLDDADIALRNIPGGDHV